MTRPSGAGRERVVEHRAVAFPVDVRPGERGQGAEQEEDPAGCFKTQELLERTDHGPDAGPLGSVGSHAFDVIHTTRSGVVAVAVGVMG